MTQTQPTQVVNWAEIGQAIDQELAAKMVKNYQDEHPDEIPMSFTIGRKIIEQIFAQPGCVAIRIYNAINETGNRTLVYAGVDEKGHTITEYPSVDENGKLGKVEALLGDWSRQTVSWVE